MNSVTRVENNLEELEELEEFSCPEYCTYVFTLCFVTDVHSSGYKGKID